MLKEGRVKRVWEEGGGRVSRTGINIITAPRCSERALSTDVTPYVVLTNLGDCTFPFSCSGPYPIDSRSSHRREHSTLDSHSVPAVQVKVQVQVGSDD